MKLILTLMLAVLPAAASDSKAVAQSVPVPVAIEVGNFDHDVEEAWGILRKLMGQSRAKTYIGKVNADIRKKDLKSAQSNLDKMVKEFPNLKQTQGHVIQVYQGMISFWNRDYKTAYESLNAGVLQIERLFPNGVKPENLDDGDRDFVAGTYFGRGAAEIQLGKYEWAVADIDKAYALIPKAYMQLNKCRALLQLKKFEEAAAAYELTYKMDPKTAESEDKSRICEKLWKNGLLPKPCAKTEKADPK